MRGVLIFEKVYNASGLLQEEVFALQNLLQIVPFHLCLDILDLTLIEWSIEIQIIPDAFFRHHGYVYGLTHPCLHESCQTLLVLIIRPFDIPPQNLQKPQSYLR